jgi:hypothetical protein
VRPIKLANPGNAFAKSGYCSVQAEKHHIHYRIRGTHIEIIDVLHQSMAPDIHLGEAGIFLG